GVVDQSLHYRGARRADLGDAESGSWRHVPVRVAGDALRADSTIVVRVGMSVHAGMTFYRRRGKGVIKVLEGSDARQGSGSDRRVETNRRLRAIHGLVRGRGPAGE